MVEYKERLTEKFWIRIVSLFFPLCSKETVDVDRSAIYRLCMVLHTPRYPQLTGMIAYILHPALYAESIQHADAEMQHDEDWRRQFGKFTKIAVRFYFS